MVLDHTLLAMSLFGEPHTNMQWFMKSIPTTQILDFVHCTDSCIDTNSALAGQTAEDEGKLIIIYLSHVMTIAVLNILIIASP